MIKSIKFFLLLFYFLSFLFPCFFCPLSLGTFSCYIPWFSYHSPRTRVNQVLGASSCPISHLLEPFTTGYKAACLLFRHHLHINAARELGGKHLMWRQQLLQIFVILRPYPLSSIWPSPCRKVPLKQYIKGIGMFLATSDKSSEVTVILGYV